MATDLLTILCIEWWPKCISVQQLLLLIRHITVSIINACWDAAQRVPRSTQQNTILNDTQHTPYSPQQPEPAWFKAMFNVFQSLAAKQQLLVFHWHKVFIISDIVNLTCWLDVSEQHANFAFCRTFQKPAALTHSSSISQKTWSQNQSCHKIHYNTYNTSRHLQPLVYIRNLM